MGKLEQNNITTVNDLILSGVGSMTGEELIHHYIYEYTSKRFWIRISCFFLSCIFAGIVYSIIQENKLKSTRIEEPTEDREPEKVKLIWIWFNFIQYKKKIFEFYEKL